MGARLLNINMDVILFHQAMLPHESTILIDYKY